MPRRQPTSDVVKLHCVSYTADGRKVSVTVLSQPQTKDAEQAGIRFLAGMLRLIDEENRSKLREGLESE